MNFQRHAVMLLATGGYIGRIPFAPGTFGSLLGIPIAFVLSRLSLTWAVFLMAVLILGAVGAAHAAERSLKVKDPGCIVIDEIVGMGVTMLGVPFGWLSCAAGLILFRIFDIVKPPPVRQIDRQVAGGWGIVLDDVAAGILANIGLRILFIAYPVLFD